MDDERTRWKNWEWELFAQTLDRAYPEARFPESRYLEVLTLDQLNAVAAAMPRPRRMTNLVKPRKQLLAAYERLRTAKPKPAPKPKPKPKAVPPPTVTARQEPPPPSAPPQQKHGRGGYGIRWDDAEWEQFAQALDAAYPSDRLADGLDGLTLKKLNQVGATMPRPRQFAYLSAAQPKLPEAFARLRVAGKLAAAKPAPSIPAPAEAAKPRTPVVLAQSDYGTTYIVWKDAEWERFARALDRANPQARYIDSPDLANLSVHEMNEAGAIMERPRQFRSVSIARRPLLAAFERLRAASARFHRAPKPSEPPSPLDAGLPRERPRPPQADTASAAVSTALAKSEAKPEPEPPVVWTRDEWVGIAIEIHRMYPLSNYPQRNQELRGLTSEDIDFAQRLFPPERQIRHLKVVSFSTLRSALSSAFVDLKNRLATAALETAAKEKEKEEAERRASVARGMITPVQPTAAATPAAATQAPTAAPAPAAAPAAAAPAPMASAPGGGDTAPNPWQAAFAPLFDLVTAQLADRLRPMIAELIDAALAAPAKAMVPMAAAVAPISVPPPVEEEVAVPHRRAADVRRKLQVGICGNRNTYEHDLKREFPQIEFTCIDTPRKIDSIRNCDKVISLVSYIDHPYDRKVKRAVGDRYMPINGNLSDLRRVLTGWLADTGPSGAAQTAAMTH